MLLEKTIEIGLAGKIHSFTDMPQGKTAVSQEKPNAAKLLVFNIVIGRYALFLLE